MMTSELLNEAPWNSPGSIRMLETLNPPAPDKGWAFDRQTDHWPRQFGFTATRPWGHFVSALLLNPGESPANTSIRGVPLAGLGKRFHAWSFWDGQYLGIVDEGFSVADVPARGASLLRLTELAKEEGGVSSSGRISTSAGVPPNSRISP